MPKQKRKGKTAKKGTDIFYFRAKKPANAVCCKKINKSVPFFEIGKIFRNYLKNYLIRGKNIPNKNFIDNK